MLKRQSRHLALLLVLTMLATLFVGVGAAQAASVNTVNKVTAVADDFEGFAGGYLTIKDDPDQSGDWEDGDYFELILPDGVKWFDDSGYSTWDDYTYDNCSVTVEKATDYVIGITIDSVDASNPWIKFPLVFKVDGATGNLQVEIDPIDSAITGKTITFATVAESDMTASVDKVRKIAKNSTSEGGVIELRESSIGAVSGEAKVTIKLPSKFSFNSAMQSKVQFRGGFANCSASDAVVDGRTFVFKFDPADGDGGARGIISIPTIIKASRDASYGEIEASILVEDDGTVLDTDLVIAEYVDWGVKTKVDEVKELVTGKFEQKTGKLTIEENVPNTLLAGRDLTVELPSWVKITNYNVTTNSQIDLNPIDLGDGDKNYIDLPIDWTGDNTAKIELKLTLSMDAAQSGDIEAKIFGAGVEETTIVLAKAIAPATASIDQVAEVKIGIQSQPINDITFTEGKKGVWKEDPVNGATEPAGVTYYKSTPKDQPGRIVLSLTEGAKFASTPNVEVTDGNFEISSANVKLDDSDTKVNIPVKSESTKISTVKVSNIKLTLDRSIPEGDLKIRIGGPAIVENSRGAGVYSDTIEAGEFSTSNAVSLVAAKVITPADTNIHAVATYVIGNTIYQINGVDQAAMDQAPYIKNDRTFLPIRFVAYGLGIGDNGIIWDQVNQTVTLMKNDKVVQLKIGSTTMLVNGASITMDAAPEITAANRTCLPIRFVAEAFGAVVGWDAATQTVTVTL